MEKRSYTWLVISIIPIFAIMVPSTSEYQNSYSMNNDLLEGTDLNKVPNSSKVIEHKYEPQLTKSRLLTPPDRATSGNIGKMPEELKPDDSNKIDCSFNSFLKDTVKECSGTAGNDIMLGNQENNAISGYDGNDKLYGRNGNDRLNGGNGRDTLHGGPGYDVIIDPGQDDDYIVGDGTSEYGDDYIFAGGGNDYIDGGDGNDIIDGGNGNDIVFGKFGQDYLLGNMGDDRIDGGLGDDDADGGSGNDKIDGGQGFDSLYGNMGMDIISGGDENDKIYQDTSNPRYLTHPDGSKDVIDCGAGDDEAWINKLKDGDVAINCENVHTELDVLSTDSNLTGNLLSK